MLKSRRLTKQNVLSLMGMVLWKDSNFNERFLSITSTLRLVFVILIHQY